MLACSHCAGSQWPQDLAASNNLFMSLLVLWVRLGKGSARHLPLGVFHAVTVRGWLGLPSVEGTPGVDAQEGPLARLVDAAGWGLGCI